jgi:hypothetical protein
MLSQGGELRLSPQSRSFSGKVEIPETRHSLTLLAGFEMTRFGGLQTVGFCGSMSA